MANFEQCAHQEENIYWYAHDFMQIFNCGIWNSFGNSINLLIISCTKLEIDSQEKEVQIVKW